MGGSILVEMNQLFSFSDGTISACLYSLLNWVVKTTQKYYIKPTQITTSNYPITRKTIILVGILVVTSMLQLIRISILEKTETQNL